MLDFSLPQLCLLIPYFASVVAVWLFTNRVEVFGLFNFHDGQTVQERVLWMQQQFHNKEVWLFKFSFFEWCFKGWDFRGFSGVVVYSFIVGFGTMIGFKFLQVGSLIFYDYGAQFADFFHRLRYKRQWQPIKDFEDLEKKHNKEVDLYEKGKTELIRRTQDSETDLFRIKQENETALKSISDLKNDKVNLEKENEDLILDSILLNKLKKESAENLTIIAESNMASDQLKTKNEALLAENKKIIKDKDSIMAQNINLDSQNNQLLMDNMKLKEKIDSLGGSIDKPGSGIQKLLDTDEYIREKKINSEFKIFLKSPYLRQFDKIMKAVINHKQIDSDVTVGSRDFYITNGIIDYKDNLPIITKKGIEYFNEYSMYNAYIKLKE